jgi:uncharacterized membrane protein
MNSSPQTDGATTPLIGAESETSTRRGPLRRHLRRALGLAVSMGAGAVVPSTVLTCISAVGSGLVSGIMFTFSTVVMQSLDTLHTEAAVAAMNAINKIIINPLFFVAFFGTTASCIGVLVAAAVKRSHPSDEPLRWIGAAVYILGVIAVTALANVPLNDALAAVHISSTEQGALQREVWSNYYKPWIMWNHVRTISAVVATALLCVSLTR